MDYLEVGWPAAWRREGEAIALYASGEDEMGVYLAVISDDLQSPEGVINRQYPRNEYTGNAFIRRLVPSVSRTETIVSVVRRICAAVQAHTLDALLLFSHAYPDSAAARRDGIQEPTITLGTGLTSSSAPEFRGMAHLWSRRYEPDRQQDFRVVVPRIEMHVCFSSNAYNAPVIQALARAAHAPVFVTGFLENIENLAFEGRVLRVNP